MVSFSWALLFFLSLPVNSLSPAICYIILVRRVFFYYSRSLMYICVCVFDGMSTPGLKLLTVFVFFILPFFLLSLSLSFSCITPSLLPRTHIHKRAKNWLYSHDKCHTPRLPFLPSQCKKSARIVGAVKVFAPICLPFGRQKRKEKKTKQSYEKRSWWRGEGGGALGTLFIS